MTIDEAIAHAREKAKDQRYYANFEKNTLMYRSCVKCAEEHEQLAEWLEELKQLRENTNGYSKEDIELNRKAMYNKAIDDFVNKISESNQGHWRVTRYEHGEAVSETMSYDIGTIRLIAEQLKAGEHNG